MVAVLRGSTSRLSAIKETVAGTTPATPVMQELPINSFTPRSTNTVIASDQIRSHPFRDKMIPGRLTHEFGIEAELQGPVHDMLIETMFGAAITTKALAFADAVKSLTIEERVGPTTPFNQFTFGCLTSMSITAAAGDTTPVKMSFSGMARAGALDAASTIATSTTAASNVDPFTFIGATAKLNTVLTPTASATLNFDRALDPLMLLGSNLPREYVPGLATLTGTSTFPYDDSGAASGATISGFLTSFADVAQEFNFGNSDNSVFRKFAAPATKFTSLGRTLQERGARMQEVNWEAYRDTVSGTICTMTTQ